MKAIGVFTLLACVPFAAHAQRWEVGAVGGGSFYTSRNASLPSAPDVQASFSPGFGAGAYLGQDMGRFWGGEIRYMFQRNSMKLSGAGLSANFGAQSHAIHYDFLVHLRPSGNPVRPYFSFGAGVKQYRGTGTETLTQDLSNYVLLTRANEVTPLVSLAAGIKIRVGENGLLRFEVRDYLSPVPQKLFTPNRGAELGGWFHNFLPVLGIGYQF